MSAILIDCGHAVIRLRRLRVVSGNYCDVTVTSPSIVEEGCYQPAESCTFYLTAERIKELVAALTDDEGFKP